MNDEATLPPRERRASDTRILTIERDLQENTRLTAENTQQITALRADVGGVKANTDALMEMKAAFDNHLEVLCTYGRWARRAFYGLTGIAGAILPLYVAAKQLGWL